MAYRSRGRGGRAAKSRRVSRPRSGRKTARRSYNQPKTVRVVVETVAATGMSPYEKLKQVKPRRF